MGGGEELRALYAGRFGREEAARASMWKILCEEFFQRWVAPDATLVDLAAGGCEFVNAIRARERYAVDLNPAVAEAAEPGVTALVCPAEAVPLADASVDVVFVSNFFEHVDRPTILAVLVEARRLLRPGGRLLVLQPNIRFCAKDYWMFFDHVTPVDDRALAEAMALAGLRVVHQVTRFLPYTSKSRLPQTPLLIKTYLRVPLAWRVLGQQSFVVAEPLPVTDR